METIDKINYKGVEYNVGFKVPNNDGAHNCIYRGEDITELFYSGMLSEQIAAGTFDDVFIGDYIIGRNSGRKYLVADINYKLHFGDTEITTPHILMLSETTIGVGAKMNDTSTATTGYVDSNFRTTNFDTYKAPIIADIGEDHILKHRNYFAKTNSNTSLKYETTGTWTDADIELMNEFMIYGSNVAHNIMFDGGSTFPMLYTQDNSQLALFRLKHDMIIARNEAGSRVTYWLRDAVDGSRFAAVNNRGSTNYNSATTTNGIRPVFLLY